MFRAPYGLIVSLGHPAWIKGRVGDDDEEDKGGSFLGFGQRHQLCPIAPPSSR